MKYELPMLCLFLSSFLIQYDSKISPEELQYDCGVELTPDGQFCCRDYQTHTAKGIYSLHSLYFLLWANFGAFCMSMLTQPDSQSKIHGSLVSKCQPIRHYCVSRVKSLWINLRDNLGLLEEERSFLMNKCLMNLYQVSNEKGLVGTLDSLIHLHKQLCNCTTSSKMIVLKINYGGCPLAFVCMSVE